MSVLVREQKEIWATPGQRVDSVVGTRSCLWKRCYDVFGPDEREAWGHLHCKCWNPTFYSSSSKILAMLKEFIWQPQDEIWMEDDEWMSKECSPRIFDVWSQQTNWTSLMIYDLTSKNLNASSALSSFPPLCSLYNYFTDCKSLFFHHSHFYFMYKSFSLWTTRTSPPPTGSGCWSLCDSAAGHKLFRCRAERYSLFGRDP